MKLDQTASCRVCQIPITFIGKLESNDEDKAEIFRRLGIDVPQEQIQLRANMGKYHRHSNKGMKQRKKDPGNGVLSDPMMEAYSGLDLKIVQKLYDIYKLDFEIFDYSPEECFKVARQ